MYLADVKRMAQECGAETVDHKPVRYVFTEAQLLEFSIAVEETTLENCAHVCERMRYSACAAAIRNLKMPDWFLTK